MKKVFRIAATEFLNSLRSKAFIISALAVPVIYGVVFLAMHFANKQTDTTDKRFAVVDGTGRLFDTIAAAADKRGDIAPRFIPEAAVATDDQAGDLLSLSERVRAEELFAFLIIDADALDETVTGATIDYYSGTPTYRKLSDWLERTLGREIRRHRFEREGFDIETFEKLNDLPAFRGMELVEVADSGEVELGKEDDEIRHFAVPFVMVMMMFVLVMTSAPALLTTSLEEKTNKVFEFLVSAVTPFQLMLGKLLGAILTALTLSVIYVGGASAVAAKYGILGQLSPSIFLWFFFLLALSVMIYGSVCVALGSVCSEIRDAQGLMLPVTLLMVVPMTVLQPVLTAPAGAFARAVTYFPPATPTMLVLRNAIPPGLPWWELVLGTVVSVVFMVFAVWAAAKVFRIGVLSQGQTPTLPRLAKWVFSK